MRGTLFPSLDLGAEPTVSELKAGWGEQEPGGQSKREGKPLSWHLPLGRLSFVPLGD